MSFSEDCVQFGDRLAKLVDAGATVREAGERLGISHQRCYAILRATGRAAGSTRAVRRGVDPAAVVAVFDATGSVNAAAKASGISHASARRVLVDKGLISNDRQPYGKPQARARFLELLELGWSASRAAREVGVHVRTARDWRDGIRKIGNTRIRPDGTVTHYADSARYTQPVTISSHASAPVINSRYLSLPDRLAIADGLAATQTMTAIAAGIGKHTSTVSREIRGPQRQRAVSALSGTHRRSCGPCPPQAVQTGHRPEPAPGGRRRVIAAVVAGTDLAQSGQGLPRRREYAREPRDDLPGAVLPGPRRTQT